MQIDGKDEEQIFDEFAQKGFKAGQLKMNLSYRDRYLNLILLENNELRKINRKLHEKMDKLLK